MKHALTIAAAVMLPLLAIADEPASAAPPAAATTTTAAPAQDSPMVAAAKRAKRKGRKPANVITNETLSKSGAGAHVTTTAVQRPFASPKSYDPPAPTPEMIANRARESEKRRAAAEAAAQAKAAAEATQKAAAVAEGMDEDGLFEEGEAVPEQTGTAPQTTTQKPPQR
jgi:hypothetical protein